MRTRTGKVEQQGFGQVCGVWMEGWGSRWWIVAVVMVPAAHHLAIAPLLRL